MGLLIQPELTLDWGLSSEAWIPKSIGEFLGEVSSIRNISEKILKIDDYVNRLQDEMKKIDAFKRELPLCMILLSNAIAIMKEELQICKKSNAGPVLEEFIPLKKICTSDDENKGKIECTKEKDINSCGDKKNWMSSVQLCISNNPNPIKDNSIDSKLDNKRKNRDEEEIDPRNGLFAPFNHPVMVGKEGRDELVGGVLSLSLRTPEIANSKKEEMLYTSGISSKSSETNDHLNSKAVQQQTARKQRRCWSPELHRRFVNALQHLGGAQAATPKQIRELMQVDGLTNDEVKSHLQKFRLHTRKVPPTANASNAAAPQSSSKQCNSLSGSPEDLLGSSRGTSTTGSDSDEDDGKSQNHCWKSHKLLVQEREV